MPGVRRVVFRHVAPLGLLLSALACGRSPAAPPPVVHTVTIEMMRFTPETLTVRTGDTVVWVNKDMFPHTATAAGGGFDSGSIASGESWSQRLTSAGEYPYVCSLHPPMKAVLRVQ
jgi:plastocyanin